MGKSWQMGLAVVGLIALMVACDREDVETEVEEVEVDVEETTQEEDGVIEFPSNDWSCEDESVERIAAWVEAYAQGPEGGVPVTWTLIEELVERDGALPRGIPVLVEIVGEEAAVEGEIFESPEGLVDWMEDRHEQRQREAQMMDDEPGLMLLGLAIEPGLSASTLDSWLGPVLDAEGLESDTIALAFSAPEAPSKAEDIPEELVEGFEGLMDHGPMPGDELMGRRDEMVEACPQLGELSDGLEAIPVDQRLQRLAEGIGEAWVACECNFDMEFFVAARMWQPGQDDDGDLVSFEEVAADELGQALAEAGDDSWAEVVESWLD